MDLETLIHSYGGYTLLFMLSMGWDDVLVILALMIVSATITALTAKRPAVTPDPAPSLLSDFQIPNITEGTAQTVVFGDVWLTSWQVLWYGDLETEAIKAPRKAKK